MLKKKNRLVDHTWLVIKYLQTKCRRIKHITKYIHPNNKRDATFLYTARPNIKNFTVQLNTKNFLTSKNKTTPIKKKIDPDF